MNSSTPSLPLLTSIPPRSGTKVDRLVSDVIALLREHKGEKAIIFSQVC